MKRTIWIEAPANKSSLRLKAGNDTPDVSAPAAALLLQVQQKPGVKVLDKGKPVASPKGSTA
ncbi:MAG: hypothetical protein AB1813_02890, partial [Verrucomicrobiota bacterium]